jgi:hypothetical protein
MGLSMDTSFALGKMKEPTRYGQVHCFVLCFEKSKMNKMGGGENNEMKCVDYLEFECV